MVSSAPPMQHEVETDDEQHICTSVLDNNADSKYLSISLSEMFHKNLKIILQKDILINIYR